MTTALPPGAAPPIALVEHQVAWWTRTLGNAVVTVDTSADMSGPTVQVGQPVGSEYHGTGRYTITYLCFDDALDRSLDLARQVAALAPALMHDATETVDTALGATRLSVSWASTTGAPHWVPYENTSLYAHAVTLTVTAHAART